jgi:eukaryotic-like serine/threonine-protein kinase
MRTTGLKPCATDFLTCTSPLAVGYRWNRALALFLVLFAACTAAPPPPPPVRFTVALPGDRVLSSLAVSADGEQIAYSAESAADGRRRIFIGALVPDKAIDRELADTAGASTPFFSPDGSSLAFFRQGAIWRMPIAGGTGPVRVADAPTESAGGAWTQDGRIVFAPLGRSGLMEVSAAGGTPSALTDLNDDEAELEHGWPHVLPDGSIVFTVSQRGRDPHVEVLSPQKQRTRLRVPITGQAQFVETGHLVYSFLGNLMMVRFSLDTHAIEGVPVAVAKGIQTSSGFGTLGRAGFSVSRTGTLAWVRAGADDAKNRLVRVGRDGKVSPLSGAADVLQTPRLSPDGRRLAVVARSGVMTREIRVVDATAPDRIVRTIQGGDNQSPAWMDRRRLTFGSNREGLQKIYVVAVDGTRPPAPLFTVDATVARNPGSWSRPPRLLGLYEIEPARGRNVLVYRTTESVAPVAATGANERSPALSPDGRWIAYVSDASGFDEVYVARLDRSDEGMQITIGGAAEPVWAREGLFYRAGESIVLRALNGGNLEDPRVIFEGHFERDPGSNLAAYDVDPQGRFFIMLKSAWQPREVRVVKNWGSELLFLGLQ